MITIIILASVLLMSCIANIIQIRRQEVLEEYIEELENSNNRYYDLFISIKNRLNEDYLRLKNIDRLGSFESDDETGFVFKDILDTIKQIEEDIT